LHTQYIKKHLANDQKKEVLLFKQFLRGIGCYGAEAEIEGFSGYLCEILIIKYKSFQLLIEHAKNWKYGHKISLIDISSPDFETPLVFIDPVDSERNVSSAISEKKFDFFIKACCEYIKQPRMTFFFPKRIIPWDLNKIAKTVDKRHFVAVDRKRANRPHSQRDLINNAEQAVTQP